MGLNNPWIKEVMKRENNKVEVCYVSGKKSDLVEKYLVGSSKTHL